LQTSLYPFTNSESVFYKPSNNSEIKIYELINSNKRLALKYLYKKVNRRQIYSTLSCLKELGEVLETNLFIKHTELCPLTNQPIIIIEFVES